VAGGNPVRPGGCSPSRRCWPAGTGSLVTGAASGIGRACADALRARGASVIGLDVTPTKSRVDYLGLQVDVTDTAAVELAIATLFTQLHPLLKLAPRGGRAVVVGSKNVPAPGPGAAAYSASKAAVTQLARVAAV
jgi:NAD(P)-dependent dehydrogenase (short-subunit alcohol dehydrogenase family)